MSFVVKQIILERVEWLSQTAYGWWSFVEDIDQRYEFDSYEEAQQVQAHSEDEARLIHPKACFPDNDWWFSSSWCSKDQTHTLKVEELGIAYDHLQPGTVVMSSFNAG